MTELAAWRRRFAPGSTARLRALLALMFLGLALPAALLVRQAFVRLELEEFRSQQLIADSIVRRIDATLSSAIAIENARPVTDFQFASAGAAGDIVQLSPLSSIAPVGAFPGAIGYFEVDAAGQLSTPLLPEPGLDVGALEEPQLQSKVAVARELTEVLEANQLLRRSGQPAAPAPPAASSSASSLGSASAAATSPASAGSPPPARGDADRPQASARPIDERPGITAADAGARTAELERAASFDDAAGGQLAFDRLAEQSALRFAEPEAAADELRQREEQAAGAAAVRVASFAGEIEPLRFSLLDSGHIVLFRNAWRDGQRYVQGLLVDRAALIRESFTAALAGATLADGSELAISIAGQAAGRLGVSAGAGIGDSSGAATRANSIVTLPDAPADAPAAGGDALLKARLSPPLSDIELTFTAGALDRGPTARLLVFTSIALAAVLVGGFVSMYRFGIGQLKLARAQRNFVSAVSHELKTPLTSIRMYGEMLKSGWADDDKRQRYYDFIVDEGERLSRLIENVLVLSRLNHGGASVRPEPIGLGELFDLLESKLASQAERAGFALEFERPDAAEKLSIAVDADALTQVYINLVDNAIKFSADAADRRIVLAARRQGSGELLLLVRDFGPGIPPAALRRLFELFYRPDNELTRATSGTGIGLALVRELVTAMGGRVDVRNASPGAEFRLCFRLVGAAPAG